MAISAGIAAAIGGVASGVGSLVGGSKQATADNRAAQQALTGFNYLTTPGNGFTNFLGTGSAANAQAAALLGVGGAPAGGGAASSSFGTPLAGTPAGGLLYPNQASRGNTPLQDIQQAIAAGKTITPAQWQQAGYAPPNAASASSGAAGITSPGSANSAFANYLNSTGYNFQMKQGQAAITGSAAARGMLNSGATAKALAQYGQGLAAQGFNNYLNQLGNVANRGLQAGEAIGSAGTAGGANAAGYTQGIGQAQSQSLNNAIGGFSNALGNIFGAVGGGDSGIPSFINVTPNQITGGY